MEQPQQHERAAEGVASGSESRQQGPAGSRALSRLAAVMGAGMLGVLLGGAGVHFALERPSLEASQARVRAYEQELASVRGRLEQASSAAAALEGQLRVEESTRRGLETALRTVQSELGQAHDSLAFYEQLMPPGPKGAVAIRALDIERVGPHLEYRLLLMRSGANDKPFQGHLQFLADGRLDGEKISLTLLPTVVQAADEGGAPALGEQPDAPDNARTLAAAATNGQAASSDVDSGVDLLALEFADFQRGSGLLSLPPGFEPESVTVNVLEGRSLRTSRRVELRAGD